MWSPAPGGQRVEHEGLNEMSSLSLDPQLSVWGELRGVVLLRVGFEVSKDSQHFELGLPASCYLCSTIKNLTLWNRKPQVNPSFSKLPYHGVYHSNRNAINTLVSTQRD